MSKNIILIIYGLPGVGKSRLIKELLNYYKIDYLQIDNIWDKCVFNHSYTLKNSQIVFKELLQKIKEVMIKKQSLVVEGVFASKSRLLEIRNIANSHNYLFKSVLLIASEKEIKRRLIMRNKEREISSKNWNMLKEKTNSTSVADIVLCTENKSQKNIVDLVISELELYKL
jgi:predicted kinase